MKRYAPYFASIAGMAVLMLLLPRFNVAQPRGIRLTRAEAITAADAQARRLGIPVEKAWSVLVWEDSRLLENELQSDPESRRKAIDDPVLGPRLGSYRRVHYRR